jgi:hypothetical protein
VHIKLSKFINGFACGITASLFLLSGLQSTYQAEPLPQEASSGKELFQRNHCSTCHSISSSGGCLAPPLDDVASGEEENLFFPELLTRKLPGKNSPNTKFRN